MVKKKIPLNSEKLEQIKGFEEVFDLISDDDIEAIANSNLPIEDYEIYDFLLKENIRLLQIDSLFGTKLKVQKKYDQIDHLLDEQISNQHLAQEDVIGQIAVKDSNFMKNLSKFFDKFSGC